MFKYFHILRFLMTHDLTFLKECWDAEFIKDGFSWRKVLTRIIKKSNRNFYFWWRLANEMFMHGNKKQRDISKKMNFSIMKYYGVEIGLGAIILKGFRIIHFSSITVTEKVVIGENFQIKQGTTIGIKKNIDKIVIGNNVNLGAMCCIIGDKLTIGDNVVVGAMSFINKDIPSNCTVYTEKTNKIIINR